MHARQRRTLILDHLGRRGFLSFQELDAAMHESPATIRRDLDRLAREGLLRRVHGGAERIEREETAPQAAPVSLTGIPFHENANRHEAEKRAIGRAAAALCRTGEAVMIDGGSTTLQMCPHLEGLGLQVLTNSLHIVSALLPQAGTRILVPAGTVFREQNIILSAAADEGMPRFHAPRLFMGAAAVGPVGLMQADVMLASAERRLIDRADQIIVLIDSSKFTGPSGHVVCPLRDIDTIVTDGAIQDGHAHMIEAAGIELIRAE